MKVLGVLLIHPFKAGLNHRKTFKDECTFVWALGNPGRCYTYRIIRLQLLRKATPVSLQAFL